MKRKRNQLGAHLVHAGLILLGLYIFVFNSLISEYHHALKFDWLFAPLYGNSGAYLHTCIALFALTLAALGVALHLLLNSPLLNRRSYDPLGRKCVKCGYDLRGTDPSPKVAVADRRRPIRPTATLLP